MAKQKGMSFVEKAGLFFGIVGVLADFTALVSFTYGFASLDQFTPSHISPDAATSFFKWFSGLIIIYAWLIASWYFVRRSFVLRYEKPRGYKNPLDSRSQRTIFGIALFLFPTFIYWSIVNITFSTKSLFFSIQTQQIETTLTPIIEANQTSTVSITDTPIETITETPIITSTTMFTLEADLTLTPVLASETPKLVATETAIPASPIIRNISPDELAKQNSNMNAVMYYVFGLPILLLIFGGVIFLCINSLMPIVHIELLDDYE